MRRARPSDYPGMEAAFSAITQASYQSQISYAVAAKAMSAVRQQGDAAIALLQSAVEVQARVGSVGEAAAAVSAGQAVDETGRLDVTA